MSQICDGVRFYFVRNDKLDVFTVAIDLRPNTNNLSSLFFSLQTRQVMDWIWSQIKWRNMFEIVLEMVHDK